MGIRRWFMGTFRPDAVETDSLTTDRGSVTDRLDISQGNKVSLEERGEFDAKFESAWCWFQEPRAQYISDMDRVLFGYLTSYGSNSVRVGAIDPSDQSLDGEPTQVFIEGVDDHRSPTILHRQDGHIGIFAASNTEIRYSFSDNPNDISSFGTEQTISESGGHYYPSPFQVSNDTIYLFYRDGNGNWVYRSSTDGGSSWSGTTDIFSSTQGYCKIYQNEGSDVIHIAATDKQGGQANPPKDIGHMTFQNGSLFDSHGNSITAPASTDDMTTVYDSSASGNDDSWIWDVAADADENPAVTFATFPRDNWLGTGHQYQYGRYDGSSWTVNRVTAAGGTIAESREALYSPGIVVDDANLDRVYLSRGIPRGASSLERWETADEGATWQHEEIAPADTQNVRPLVPWYSGSRSPEVLWMQGNYIHFDRFETGIAWGRDTSTVDTQIRAGTRGHAYCTTASTLSNNSRVVFDDLETQGTDVDWRNEWDTANNKFVAAESGWYDIQTVVEFSDCNSGDEIALFLMDGNSNVIKWLTREFAEASTCALRGSASIYMSQGEEVTVRASFPGSISRTLATGEDTTWCQVKQDRR